MDTTQLIEFLQDYTVKAADGATYEKGQVIELPYASARHFVTRNVAIVVTPKPKAEQSKSAKVVVKPGGGIPRAV